MNSLTDSAARIFATDPAHNVVLEASAGTGKTFVLVARYLNLLRADVSPANILAITFTRQAAAEMRERIIHQLRLEATESRAARVRWNDLRDRLGEVTISTLDAFCLSLLREFPLEADLDPDFGLADETEVPRLVEEAVDRALATATGFAERDAGVAILLARLGPQRARVSLMHLLERRLVVPSALHRFLVGVPRDLTGERACRDAARRLADSFAGARREVEWLIGADVPEDPAAAMLARDLDRPPDMADAEPSAIRAWLERLRVFFLTQTGVARTRLGPRTQAAGSARQRYREAAATLAPLVRDVLRTLDRDINAVMAGAVHRVFGVAVSEYQRTLQSRALLDFSDVLQRAVDLLRQMDEFARSRYRFESRYHHVLVDEFQDTNWAQWELVSLLVKSWGEGSGLVHEAPLPPTIFIVGDRKQSIYRFRDADVSMLQQATQEIASLRAEGEVRCSIAHSFRAVPGLLRFVNDLFAEIGTVTDRRDAFRFETQDQFPLDGLRAGETRDEALGVIAADEIETCATAVADEIVTVITAGRVRDKDGSGTREVRPGDVAILFRTRESHREFEYALERRSIPTYVYKGLGFFDADEIKDVRALIRYLANPWSELRAAALLRSRFVGLSDPGLLKLAGNLSRALVDFDVPSEAGLIEEDDRRALAQARVSLRDWVGVTDRLPPAEVLDRVLLEGAYAFELRGPRLVQAQENLKRVRGLLRRLQNRGYTTMARAADHIDHLSRDTSNAVVEALDAVNLMTVHAAKGLEFPIVFLVDLGRGTGTRMPPVRVVPDRGDGQPSVTVLPYRSGADEDEQVRNTEETKRLLYVATTRARDRLYLSTVLDGGNSKFNRGSFGKVLPTTFASVFERAARTAAGQRVVWQGQSGDAHAFRVCAATSGLTDVPAPESLSDTSVSATASLGRMLSCPSVARVPVTAALSSADVLVAQVGDADMSPPRLIGRLVHLLMRRYAGRPIGSEELGRCARELRTSVPGAEVGLTENAILAAARLYTRIGSHEAMTAVAEHDRLFEVSFSFLDADSTQPRSGEGTVVRRGTIDCLVRSPNGQVTVLEFKTGSPRPEHQQQLDSYVAAARAMFPKAPVRGQLVYAS